MADELSGELVCYARSVAGVQWHRMEDGTIGEDLNPWAVKLFETLQTVDPRHPPSRPPTANGSTSGPTGKRPAATESTAPSA